MKKITKKHSMGKDRAKILVNKYAIKENVKLSWNDYEFSVSKLGVSVSGFVSDDKVYAEVKGMFEGIAYDAISAVIKDL